MNNKANIKRDGSFVVVISATGKEIFRKPATEQYKQIAHCIYMYEKFAQFSNKNYTLSQEEIIN